MSETEWEYTGRFSTPFDHNSVHPKKLTQQLSKLWTLIVKLLQISSQSLVHIIIGGNA